MNFFTAKYRVGRYLLWLAILGATVAVLAATATWLFHPPLWLMAMLAVVIGIAAPNPKWVKR